MNLLWTIIEEKSLMTTEEYYKSCFSYLIINLIPSTKFERWPDNMLPMDNAGNLYSLKTITPYVINLNDNMLYVLRLLHMSGEMKVIEDKLNFFCK